MLFALLCTDKPNSLDLRMQVRPEHLTYLESLGSALKAAGPFTSDEGQPIVEVCNLAHRDSTSEVDTWECVDIRAVEDLPRPVTLDEIKADPKLKDMVLVNNSRLSVQPVSEAEFRYICKLGGLKP